MKPYKDRSDFTGFVLEYESEPTGLPDFTNFWSSTEWLHEQLRVQIRKLPWKNINPIIG